MKRICIFVVAFDIVFGDEHIYEDNFYLIRILTACISGGGIFSKVVDLKDFYLLLLQMKVKQIPGCPNKE